MLKCYGSDLGKTRVDKCCVSAFAFVLSTWRIILTELALSLIFPAYYDENNIGPLVERSLETLAGLCDELEIIIVEDGSPDGTGRVADSLAARHHEVTAVHHEKNRGHGAALKTGIANCSKPIIAFMDGDGQYDPVDLRLMLDLLEDADLVQGRRRVYPNGMKRLLISRFYNLCIRSIFSVPFKDLGCSIKVFRREVAQKCMPEPDGIFAQGELVLRAHYAGFRVVEAPANCYPRKSGRSSSMSPGNVQLLLRDMSRLRSKLRNQ